MKKFLLIVIATVGVGLALRYTINRPAKSKSKPTVQETATKPVPPTVVEKSKPEPEQPAPVPEPPPPPRIKGSTLVSDTSASHYAAAPGVIYYCEGGSVMAAPKAGGPAQRVGECDGAFDFVADAQAVFYCDDNKLKRITHGTDSSHIVVYDTECIMSALDGKYAYYVVPGFEGEDAPKNPGVYRVARTGGQPERIHATRPKEQFMLAVDDEALWVGAWSAGTISKLAKTPGAKARTVVTGQKGIVDLGVDDKSLYWYVENSGEIRRRKKAGGAIEVIGHEVDQEPIIVVDGHAYWFSGPADKPKRLMHLAPGAAAAEQLADGLQTPSMRADSEGVYVNELDRDGIFMFKR